jgi:opacity protein-like surface antigen
VGEVGGNYKSITVLGTSIDLNVHSFLAGARFASRQNPSYMPFGQFLVGAARASAGVLGVSESNTAFAFQPGAGVDIALTEKVGVRVQGDYRAIRDEGQTTSEFRFAVGVVFGVGAR